MFDKIKKTVILLFLMFTLCACKIENTIQINNQQSGRQTVSISIPNEIMSDLPSKEEIMNTLENQKPFEEIVIESKEVEDNTELSYYFDFKDVEDYKNKAFIITNEDIDITLSSKGNPMNGSTIITIPKDKEDLFLSWIKKALSSFSSYKDYKQQIETVPIDSFISYNESEFQPVNNGYTYFNEQIKISQLDIQTVVKETSLYRSFTYTFETPLSNTDYVETYLNTFKEQLEFDDPKASYKASISDKKFIIAISSTLEEDISLLTTTLFDTSSFLSANKLEDTGNEYEYIDYFYPGVSIFGEINVINYYVNLPTKAQTKTFHNINYDDYEKYYGIVDYKDNSIVINNIHEAIDVEMTYEIRTTNVTQEEIFIKTAVLFALFIVFIFIFYYYFKKKKAITNQEIIQNETIDFSFFKDVFKTKDKYTIISTLIYSAILFLVGFIAIYLIINQLQNIYMNQEAFEIYESFDFLQFGKASFKDLIALIPMVYGTQYKLMISYYDFGGIYLIINIGLLMLVPLVAAFITNGYLRLQEISPKRRFLYLLQSSFITSFLVLMIVIFKNAQMSNELEVLHYHVSRFIVHFTIINIVNASLISLLGSSLQITKVSNLLKHILSRYIFIFALTAILLICIYLYYNAIEYYPVSFINSSAYALFIISGGMIQIDTTLYTLLSAPYFIIPMIVFYYIMSAGLKDIKQQYPTVNNYLFYGLVSIIYTVLEAIGMYLLELSFTSLGETLGVFATRSSIITIFLTSFIMLLFFSNIKESKVTKQIKYLLDEKLFNQY